MKETIARWAFLCSAVLCSAFFPLVGAPLKGVSTSTVELHWLSDYNAALAEARQLNKKVLILFTGTQWCPACLRLEKTILSRPEFTKGVEGKFIFLKAEFPDYREEAIQASPYASLLRQYDVSVFPTFVVVDSEGKKIKTVDYQTGGIHVYLEAFNGL